MSEAEVVGRVFATLFLVVMAMVTTSWLSKDKTAAVIPVVTSVVALLIWSISP